MTSVAPGDVLSASNPALATWIASSFGFLKAPDALSWSIVDSSTETTVASGTVDLTADIVSLGRYAVSWTVPSNETTGRHRVDWTATVTSTDQEGTSTTRTSSWSKDFDVLASGGSQQRGYALVSDLRDEGLTVQKASDALLVRKIREASDYFERATGQRWFEPRYMEWNLDGTWRPTLLFDHPIIAIGSATVFGEGLITPDLYKVNNRHLSGLLQPDDRVDPKLEFVITQPGLQGPVQPLAYPYPISASWLTPKVWAKGTQNVTVTGVFGYTDPDGGPEGETPSLVRRAIKLLVFRDLPQMAKPYDRFDALNRHRITNERTREQSYTLAPGKAGMGAFTSDWDLDSIIEFYSRPPQMVAV